MQKIEEKILEELRRQTELLNFIAEKQVEITKFLYEINRGKSR